MRVHIRIPSELLQQFLVCFDQFAQQHRSQPFEMMVDVDDEDGDAMTAEEAVEVLRSVAPDVVVEKLTKQ